jgi:hypothetical protein
MVRLLVMVTHLHMLLMDIHITHIHILQALILLVLVQIQRQMNILDIPYLMATLKDLLLITHRMVMIPHIPLHLTLMPATRRENLTIQILTLQVTAEVLIITQVIMYLLESTTLGQVLLETFHYLYPMPAFLLEGIMLMDRILPGIILHLRLFLQSMHLPLEIYQSVLRLWIEKNPLTIGGLHCLLD